MNEATQFLTIGLATDDGRPMDPSLGEESLFLRVCFKLDLLRVTAEMSPSCSKDPSLGELWRDLPPDNGRYLFELATELPFWLPNLDGRPEYLINVGATRLFVCNRMVRAYIGAGYPLESGFSYFLAHQQALPQIALHREHASGIHPVPLRSFVSLRIVVEADKAESAVESSFLSWRAQLLAAVARLVATLRETVPTKVRNALPPSSVAAFPVFWLAIEAASDVRACEQFASHLSASAPKPMENLTSEEAKTLGERLATAGPPDWRQAFGLAETFHFYGYHELAVVQLCVACETALATRLKRYLLSRGISKKTLKEQFDDITFAQLLNIHLPCMCDLTTLGDRNQVLGDINWARKRRNEIVHQGCVSEVLSAARIAQVHASAKQLVSFLVDDH